MGCCRKDGKDVSITWVERITLITLIVQRHGHDLNRKHPQRPALLLLKLLPPPWLATTIELPPTSSWRRAMRLRILAEPVLRVQLYHLLHLPRPLLQRRLRLHHLRLVPPALLPKEAVLCQPVGNNDLRLKVDLTLWITSESKQHFSSRAKN
jgi:hypothetical protein